MIPKLFFFLSMIACTVSCRARHNNTAAWDSQLDASSYMTRNESRSFIAALWHAGFRPPALEQFLCIAWFESRYRTSTFSSDGRFGAWQIHEIHKGKALCPNWRNQQSPSDPGSIYNLELNAACAFRVWSVQGYEPWPSWSDPQRCNRGASLRPIPDDLLRTALVQTQAPANELPTPGAKPFSEDIRVPIYKLKIPTEYAYLTIYDTPLRIKRCFITVPSSRILELIYAPRMHQEGPDQFMHLTFRNLPECLTEPPDELLQQDAASEAQTEVSPLPAGVAAESTDTLLHAGYWLLIHPELATWEQEELLLKYPDANGQTHND